MANFLYNLIIHPLYQIIEVTYFLVARIFNNDGLAVIGVSIAVTFLCLPLYIVAEKWQQIERDKQAEMSSGISRIKKAFKGDEQYMILTTYYKQNHYHPLMALRSSFSLLIQIPFFIAAYKYLSHLEALQGQSFLFIKDMGAPDGLLTLGSLNINLLPIVMTLINIISGIIYTKGFSWKEKAPIFIMPLIFLVILYSSPAGLLLYWTMNNVFSLIKNIFYKFKKPFRVLYLCISAVFLLLDYYLLFKHPGYLSRRLLLVGVTVIFYLLPLFIKLIVLIDKKFFANVEYNSKNTTTLFFLSTVSLCLLMGYLIPSTVISSSPAEFSFIDEYNSPFFFLFNTTSQFIGLFIIWFTCIFYLFNNKVKSIIALVFSILCFSATINTFIFPGQYGLLSPNLQFSEAGVLKSFNITTIINFAVLLIPVIVILILYHFKKIKFVSYFLCFILPAFLVLSLINTSKISKGYKQTKIVLENTKQSNVIVKPVYHLSKTEKNVVVIMLDRGYSPYIPVILEEKPELNTIFKGFTYYPNAVSFGNQTMAGTPPLWGGYDYTPQNINKRSTESLVSKHNEALLVVPRIFNNAGYKVTINDPSWANYNWVPDLRIYENDPDLTVFNTIKNYTDPWLQINPELISKGVRSSLMKRNFLWYSLLRTSPLAIRDIIYNKGNYWNTKKDFNDVQDILSNYAVLDLLPELTDYNSITPTYTFITNELTHEPGFFQAPDYVPSINITNYGNGPYKDIKPYHSNMAAFLRIGEWLSALQEAGVYDNTRIIIVSDHGDGAANNRFKGKFPVNANWLNCVLLVKDFNQTGNLKTDNEFMCNADVPALSMKDIIDNPVNPNTGNVINSEPKKDGVTVIYIPKGTPGAHYKNKFKLDDNSYYHVDKDITVSENWKPLTLQQAEKGDN